MAQPPNKKQKTAGPVAPPPIVFQSPGIQPDVRLKVFNTEFHVHSTILKLYSAFFRKFLDSPDKAQVTAEPANLSISTRMPIAPTRFKYEWVTKMDDDISEEEQTTNDAIGWYWLLLLLQQLMRLVIFCPSITNTMKVPRYLTIGKNGRNKLQCSTSSGKLASHIRMTVSY